MSSPHTYCYSNHRNYEDVVFSQEVKLIFTELLLLTKTTNASKSVQKIEKSHSDSLGLFQSLLKIWKTEERKSFFSAASVGKLTSSRSCDLYHAKKVMVPRLIE